MRVPKKMTMIATRMRMRVMMMTKTTMTTTMMNQKMMKALKRKLWINEKVLPNESPNEKLYMKKIEPLMYLELLSCVC